MIPQDASGNKRVCRSCLFVPVINDRFVREAWRRGADVIILDLEDSVPATRKAEARRLVGPAVVSVSRGGAEVAVRINHDQAAEDLDAAIIPGVHKVLFPKAEHAWEINQIDEIIGELEYKQGIPAGHIEIRPLIETALGVTNVFEVVNASVRIRDVQGGSGLDMALDLGVGVFQEADVFAYGRAEVELAARAKSIEPVVSVYLGNTTGSLKADNITLASARASLLCGIHTGTAVHPNVVKAQIAGFTPTEELLQYARSVVQEFEARPTDSTSLPPDEPYDRYEFAWCQSILDWSSLCGGRDRTKGAALAAQDATC